MKKNLFIKIVSGLLVLPMLLCITNPVEAKTTVQGKEFYYSELTTKTKKMITGVSYPKGKRRYEISYSDLAEVHVKYYNFDGEKQKGTIICNKAIAQDLTEIFQELYRQKYQIEKITPVDAYDGDDELSMAANNTSAFNYRVIAGTSRLSNHAYGLAIDINPKMNPYVTYHDGKANVAPANGKKYANRTKKFAHKIDHNDLCYQLFTEHGFSWGGDWKNSKDYQHFEKKLGSHI